MLNSMKIGPKLIGGFVIVALIAAAIGYIGIKNIRTIENADTKLFEKMTVPLGQIAMIANDFQRVRVNTRDIIAANEPDKIEGFAKRIESLRDSISLLSESYEKTILTEAGRKIFDEFISSRKEYGAHLDKLMDLARANNDEAATAYLQGDMAKSSRAEQNLIEEMMDAKIKLAKETSEENTVTANTAVNTVLIFIVLGCIFALAIGIFLTLSITGPLKKGVDFVQELFKGHLGSRLRLDREDEIGQLAKTMDDFADDLQNNIVATLKKIAEGDLTATINVKDAQDEVMPALQKVVINLRQLNVDAQMLAKAAVEGRLATRADATKHLGDYRKIVEGVNSTLDSVINPLNVAAKYVDDISKGTIPPIIADNYNGDFNLIKNNLNSVVKMMNELLQETGTLVKAAKEGKLSTRANANLFVGGWNQLVAGVNETLDKVIEPVNEAAAVLEKVAARDMTVRVMGNYEGDHAKIKISLNKAVENLDLALGQVSDATSQVGSASQQIASSSQALAQGASTQASSLEEISSSLEEMTSMTKQNADNSNQAKALATEANNHASTGREAMNRMGTAIQKIKDSSDQTSKIIKTIDEIAMQTNLLALNAAVEAARAGEAGRGFAVVAEEVRNLAQRSAEAAKNTAEMIADSVKAADNGVHIAEEVGHSLDSIAISAKKVNDLIAEIASASQEQSQGIKQVNGAVSQMDRVTQQNAASSEESASAAEELSSQAEELQSMVSQFIIDRSASVVNVQQIAAKPKLQIASLTASAAARNVASAHAAPLRRSNKPAMSKMKSPEEVIPMSDADFKDF